VITPRGFTSLPTQEAEYSFSGFVPTNKQVNKQRILLPNTGDGVSFFGFYSNKQTNKQISDWLKKKKKNEGGPAS